MPLPQDYAISAVTGKPGESGTPAKFIEIEAPSGLVFKNGSPNSITLNAVAVGFTPSAYVWKKNGTTISGQTTSSLTIAKTDVTSSATYSVEADGCKDYVTLIAVSDGANGTSPYACSLSNENFSIATDTDLKPLSVPTGGYSCKFTAYKGSTQLSPIAPSAAIASGKFKISTPSSAGGIIVAQNTNGTLTFTPSISTAITENQTFSVTVTYDNGSTETKVITISASKTGAKGDKGSTPPVYTCELSMSSIGSAVTLNVYKDGIKVTGTLYYSDFYGTGTNAATTAGVAKQSFSNGSATITAVASATKHLVKIYSDADATDLLCTGFVSYGSTGSGGQNSVSYWLITDASSINVDTEGNFTPASITLTAKSKTGNGSPANYSGRFKIEVSTNGSTYTTKYTSSANEATKTYTIPASTKSVRCSLYLAGGTSMLLDQDIITVNTDGEKGDKGDTGNTGTKTFFSDYARTWTNTNWNTYKTAGYATTWNNSTVEGMRVGDILVITATLSEQGNIIGTVYTQIISVPSAKVDGYYKIGCTTLYGMVGQRGQTGATGGNGTDTWTPVLTSVTRNGNQFTKNLNSADWNAQFYSKEGFKRCFISWKASQTNGAIMVGLNSDPTLNANWNSLDYAIYLQTNGKFDIRESGTTVSVTDNTYTTSTVFRVEFDGTKVNYYKDSTLIRNVTRAEGTLLYADSSFHTYNKAIQDVSFGALGEKGADYWVKTEWIDLSADTYNQDTWYPVVGSDIPTNGEKEIKVSVQLNSGTKPRWSTHNNGFSVDFHVQDQRSGWGTTSAVCLKYIDTFNWTQATENSPNVSPVSYTQMTNSSYPVLYLRGGGKYQVSETWACTWSIKTATYTSNSQSVSPSVNSRPTPRGTYIRGSNGVSMRSKGAWAASTAYVNDASYIDVVSYNGSSYACKTSHTSGSTFDSSKWNLLANKGDRGFSSRTIAFRVNYSAFSTANDGEVYVCGYNANGAEADTYGYVIINGTTYYAKGMLNSGCAMNGYMAIQKSGATSSGSPATPVYVFEDGSNTWYQVANGLTTVVKSAISSKADWIVLAKVHSQTSEGKVSLEPMTPCLLSDINSVIEMKYEGIVAAVTNYTSAQITPYKITGNNGSFSKTALTARYVERGALVLNTNAVTPTSSTAQARMMLFDGTTWTEISSTDARYNDAILLCAGALPSLAGYYYTLGLATPNICGTYIDTLTTNRAFINEAMINLIRAYDINFKNSVSSYKDSGYVAGDLAISMGKNPKNKSDDDNNFLIQSYKTTVENTNITTMTSATTPSGTYNGQLGRYQGQLYKWNGTTWVSVDSASIELWKKEFSTKKENGVVNLFIKGNLDVTGDITSFSPNFFVGADIKELSLSGDSLTHTNGRICSVYCNGYIYNFCQDNGSTNIIITRAVYTDDMTFSLITTLSSVGALLDAMLYKDVIYLALRNGVYKFNTDNNTVTRISTNRVFGLSIIDGLLNITNAGYGETGFTFYNGTTTITKTSTLGGNQSLCHFTDDYYVACDEIAQGTLTNTWVYYYDKNFNFLGYKEVTGATVTWLDGTQHRLGFTYPIFAFNGKLFTGAQTDATFDSNGNLTNGSRERLVTSNDGGDTWEEMKDDSVYSSFAISATGARCVNYNNCVIIQGAGSYYISYNGGNDFEYVELDELGNWKSNTPYILQADEYSKDIIVPLSIGRGKLALSRIRQYNVAKPQPVRIRTSAPDNPVDGDIWIE